MGTTRQIPREEWKDTFDRFTAEHLKDTGEGGAEAATVEIVSPRLGDQLEFEDVRLLGLAYDPMLRTFRVLLEDVDHLVFYPTEIWVLEGEDGSLAIEVAGEDGGKEIIYVRRSGPPAKVYSFPPDASSPR
jgi:Family of unknown function (DUF5335)